MESRYQYLLKTSGTVDEVAEILYPVSGLGPVGDAGNIYNLCKNEMHKLIYASLDFIKFKGDDGEFLNVIPESLKLEMKEKVEAEYQCYLNSLDMQRMVTDAECEVLDRVERYAWHNGIKVLPEALEQMMNALSRCAKEYDGMDDPVDAASLLASYEDALKTTLGEWMGGTNSDDILAYRLEMIEYLEKTCSIRMYRTFERFFSILACSSVFIDLRNKLENIREYLLQTGITGAETGSLAEDADEYEVVFTDLKEHDPAKTLEKLSGILSKNL